MLYFKYFLVFILSSSLSLSIAQKSKIFFDRIGNATSESNSYYYRENLGGNKYISYYTSNNSIYFEGNIINANNISEKNNLYNGECIWYYKNGNKIATRNFDFNGKEIGISVYYLENGSKEKELNFNNEAKNNSIEYDQNGGLNKIFEENFITNSNDWFLTKNDIGEVSIINNKLHISALTDKGNSRYINYPIQSQNYSIEIELNTLDLKNGRAGILYGFKDWDNYNYFLISNFGFYLGSVIEGISISSIDGLYCSSLIKNSINNLKILSNGDHDYFSVNGEVIYKTNSKDLIGNNIGFGISGNSVAQIHFLKIKEFDINNSPKNNISNREIKKTGSGIILSYDGYLATNYHVVKDAKKIFIDISINDISKSYQAKLIEKDELNDLAILKIDDENFVPNLNIEYAFSILNSVDVGAQVYTIGYPLALNGLGSSAKFVDGRISSKTGYKNAINSYQTSIPVQPGNSGGPLFDKNGELVGIMVATVQNTDNVSYAVKLNYLLNLMDIIPEKISIPQNQTVKFYSLENQIKNLSKNVVLIKCK